MITKRSKRTIEFDSKSTAKQRFKNSCFARVHYPVLKPPRTATPSHRHTAGPQARRASNRARQKAWGGDPGAQKRIHTTPAPTARPAGQSQRRLPHQQPRRHRTMRRAGRTPSDEHPTEFSVEKEVIQPHLPVRLPCYDLVPITSLTLDGSIPQGVRPPASGAAHFHDLTGGVYKARERIHRDVADSRLLATPPSRSRVADCDPN